MAIEMVTEPTTQATEPAAVAPATAGPSTDWRASLPDDQKGLKSLERYKDLPSFVKGHLDLESAYGKKVEGLIKVPAPDAEGKLNDADVVAFRKALGVPDEPGGYQIQVSEDLAHLVSPEGIKAFAPLFHQLNLPPAAAQAIVQGFAEYSQAQMAALETKYRADLNTLKAEWGEPTYNRRLALAKKVWKTELPEGLQDLFDRTHIGSHPELITFLAKYGEDLAESGHIDAQFTTGGASKEQMEKRKDEIMADPDWVSERNPAKHLALAKEYNAIIQQLYAEPMRR